MILNVYCMFDRVSQTFGDLFTAVNDNTAQRRFQYVCANSPMVADDMQLYKVATYNTETADIVIDKFFVCNYVPVVDSKE